jgi:alpha-galactosidase
MRGQLALNLARKEVRDYLFAALDALLREFDIAYLKWDHNRDLFPSAAGQTQGFYALLDRLRTAHPAIEIESCASGGGRIDFGALARAHRVWPSDNNDPIERVRIMRAWSQFLPLEVLGNHVGPSPNPITGRRTDMDFRAKLALFGHMGVEADPARMSEAERECLAAHIALYKDWRGVLHAGDWFALDHPDPKVFAQLVVGGGTALAIAAQTGFSPEFDAAPVRLRGLEPEAVYRVTLPLPWSERGARYLPNKRMWRDGFALSGQALMTQGLALPLTHPETAWLIALERLPA